MKKGRLIVVSGPSGAGKDTIVNEYLKTAKNTYLSISCTTREKRDYEKNNVDYIFLTKEEFEEKIKEDNFLEYAIYNDNYYGTPKDIMFEKLNSGIDVILIIEVQGAKKVKELIKDAIFIFIMPPSLEVLKERLINRGTESMEKIDKRIETARKELIEVDKYNYIIVNDELSHSVDDLKMILN